ncbi:MAG: hypothetical protein JKX70_00560, partial [Phycisphaerales bacterium]|nr:hypothetical protein [Phycisphaerales bacterium]
PHEIVSDDQIVRACLRRLNQIDHHRHRSTPDAQEVRLAVHAAGSQLLDSALREQLAMRWPPGTPMSVPKAWVPSKRASRLTPEFIRSAKLLIAASGGWNTKARQRLAHFARMNRVGALELVAALSKQNQSESMAQDSRQSTRLFSGVNPYFLTEPPSSKSLEWAFVYLVLFVLSVFVIATITIAPPQIFVQGASSQLRYSAQTDPPSTPAQLLGQDEQPGVRSANPSARENLAHYTAIAHELDQLVVQAQADPVQSLERFTEVYPLFVDSWTAFPEPAFRRTVSHIVEFVGRVDGSNLTAEISATVSSVLACDPRDKNPAHSMIRATIINTVLAEPNIQSSLRAELSAIYKRCYSYEPIPQSNPMVSLVTIAGLIGVDSRLDDVLWWEQWLQAVIASTAEDESQRERLVLSAMASRLHDSSPPGASWDRTIIELVNAVSWREGSPARYWLLSQFADQAVSTARLAALTQALTLHSGAKKINAMMVLNPSDTFAQRQQLAQTYREAWAPANPSSSSSTQTDQFAHLIDEMHIRVSITPIEMDAEQATQAIIELAHLNSSAWQITKGGDTLAELLPSTSSTSRQTGDRVLNFSSNRRDIKWAQEAINVQSPNELAKLFAQLIQDNGPGINSAYALVHLASLNPDSEIRTLASGQVSRYKDHPTILIALDHAISSSRISRRLSQLVLRVVDRPLPDRTSDHWYEQAHTAMLAQLARSLAQGVDSTLNNLEYELSRAYSIRFNNEYSIKGSSESAAVQIEQLYMQMLLDAHIQDEEGVGIQNAIDQVEALTAVRQARAISPMHRFLAYQRSISALLALQVEYELPGSSLRVQDLLAELDARLDQSRSITQQIAQAERCIAQLWILRLEGSRP